MDKRRRGSISLKMIATTTALVVVIVAMFGAINYTLMSNVYSEQQQLLNDTFLQATKKRGAVQTRDLVQASRTAILQNDYTTLQGFVPEVAKDDPEVVYTFVADRERFLAHSDREQNTRLVADPVAKEMLAANEAHEKRIAAPGGDLYVVARPVVQDGQRVGTVVIAYSLRFLAEQQSKMEAEKQASQRRSLLRTAAIGLVFALLGTALAIFQGVRISRPIQTLAWRADQLARGDLATRVDISSSDEIGTLGESFNLMADSLVVLLQQTAEKATLEKELGVARSIQETLVPSGDPVSCGPFRLAGYFQPASECGGDWWSSHELEDGRLLVVIGDVTGHGVPAAMITAAAKAACDTMRVVMRAKLDVAHLLGVLNRAIFEAGRRKFVMTCFAAILDPKTRTVTFANAGHNFPYVLRPSAPEGQEFQVMMARGNRLGDVEDSSYAAATLALEPGDVLVWYTDGVVECESERGEELGEKRFRAAIRAAGSLDPVSMRDSVAQAAQQFYGARPRKDDITMVFARVTA